MDNPIQLILDADIIVKGVIILLLILSVTSWAIIIQKILLYRKMNSNCQKYLDFFQNQTNIDHLIQTSQKSTLNPLASLFLHAKQAAGRAGDQPNALHKTVRNALTRSKSSEMAFLESRVPFLATTGSSAPFIGLFGTVWGIMNAFLNIGAEGATNLAVVAPGIAEALIATAIGLVAAIPAVIGYNYCVQKVRVLSQKMDHFSSELLDQYIHLFKS